MKKKQVQTNKILDKLHRGAVWVCIGVTVLGTIELGHRVYHHFTVIRPQKKALDAELLQEGAHEMAKELTQ